MKKAPNQWSTWSPLKTRHQLIVALQHTPKKSVLVYGANFLGGHKVIDFKKLYDMNRPVNYTVIKKYYEEDQQWYRSVLQMQLKNCPV